MNELDHLSERQQVAFRVEAILRECTVAQVRRDALEVYANDLLRDDTISRITRHLMRARRMADGVRSHLRVVR